METPTSEIYRRRDFPLFLVCRLLTTLAMQVQSVAIGWHIYEITRDPFSLGLVGLCQFVPMFALTLPAGELADRRDPRRIYALCLAAEAICGALFLAIGLAHGRHLALWYVVLIAFGAARGVAGPSSQSLVPFLVPPERLPRAIAWSSSTFQAAVIAGPALGGVLYAIGAGAAFGTSGISFLIAAAVVAGLAGRRRSNTGSPQDSFLRRIADGIAFVRARPVILGAISLDLFAVLLGGATALLPVFARDILHVGPIGLGVLRSAPAAGATLMALVLGRRPLARHAGARMFVAVAIFGVGTIVFGLSRNLYVTLATLAVLGASDMVSVYIRHALVQFATPDAMRGRVSAVNVLFISASNELGEFESGVTAAWFGTVAAVVIGGAGTLLVAALWMRLFPQLAKTDKLSDVTP
ncbi:MAG: MFS transporter [Rhizomicrobium sp.]